MAVKVSGFDRLTRFFQGMIGRANNVQPRGREMVKIVEGLNKENFDSMPGNRQTGKTDGGAMLPPLSPKYAARKQRLGRLRQSVLTSELKDSLTGPHPKAVRLIQRRRIVVSTSVDPKKVEAVQRRSRNNIQTLEVNREKLVLALSENYADWIVKGTR